MSENFDLTQTKDSFNQASAEAKTDDELTLEDDISQERIMTSKQKIILVSIGAAVLLGLLGLIIGLLLFSGRSTDDDLILENVFAGGIDLSGMTVEEAVNALHLATDNSISEEPMVIRIYDGELRLYPNETNAILDVEAVAQAAYDYGRSGNHAEDQQIRKNAHRRSYTIPLLSYLNLNLDFIRNTVDSYCDTLESEYAEPTITAIGNRPVYGDPSPRHQSIKVTLGTPLRRLDAEDLYDQILDAYSMNELVLEYEAPEVLWPSKVTAQSLFDQYCTPAQDAILNSSTYEITPEVYGYGFSVTALQKMLDEAVPGETVEITLSFLEPSILANDLNNQLFQETLSTCSSTSTLDDNARDNNLLLSCNAINGKIIPPGGTFSFIEAIGDVSAEAGYTKAPISELNDVVMGGGISQTATALYYCVLHADLNVLDRHNHKYVTDFIDLGLDAYVDGDSCDLRFRNDTDMPIRIEASVNRHTVSVSLVGSKALNYRISIRTEISEKQLPITTYQMMLPNNSQGYEDGDVIVSGIEGYKVSVFKEKTDASGVLLSPNAISNNQYKKRDEVIARIGVLDTDDPETPKETTPTEETSAMP